MPSASLRLLNRSTTSPLTKVPENARFISRTNADIAVITSKDPQGKFKAMVLCREGKRREVLMSETGNTLAEALELLHAKSAEAVYNYITTYGIDLVLKIKKHNGKDGDSDSSSSSSSDDEPSLLGHQIPGSWGSPASV